MRRVVDSLRRLRRKKSGPVEMSAATGAVGMGMAGGATPGATGIAGPVGQTGPIGMTGSTGTVGPGGFSEKTQRILRCVEHFASNRRPNRRCPALERVIMRADPDVTDESRTYIVQEYMRRLPPWAPWAEGQTHLICDAL